MIGFGALLFTAGMGELWGIPGAMIGAGSVMLIAGISGAFSVNILKGAGTRAAARDQRDL